MAAIGAAGSRRIHRDLSVEELEPRIAPALAAWPEFSVGSATGGGISNNAAGSYAPALAVAPDGNPVVAWHDTSFGNSEIYVRHWDGIAWVEMGTGSASGGGISNNTGLSTRPSIALCTDGNPVVAWVDDSGGDNEIYVRRWDGTTWAEMGAGSASGGGISNHAAGAWFPSVAMGFDGNPIVGWSDLSSGDREIYVLRWDGTAWVEMGVGSASGGGISDNDGASFNPSLAMGLDGNPIVVWDDNSNGDYDIYVRRWDGSNWVETGTGSATGDGISGNSGDSEYTNLAIGSDGNPIVAWRDISSGNYEIYIRRWDGASWSEMGTDSATGGGISNNTGLSNEPSIAIGADGNPIIAWYDDTDVDQEIYVRRWDGTSWVEIGAGSATAGGISENAVASRRPSLAVGLDGQPIIAFDDESVNCEIYVRQSPAPLVALLADTPDTVTRPDSLTLTAIGVNDAGGSVTQVEFYRDSNGNGALDLATDALLGADTDGSDGWSWTGATTDFSTGTNVYFARAQDDTGLWGESKMTLGIIQNATPTIGSLNANPDPVIRPSTLTLTAGTAADIDGTVALVEFYRDENGNGTLELGTDALLGQDTTIGDGWTWSGSTSAFPRGANTFIARVQDNDAEWSNAASTTVDVQGPELVVVLLGQVYLYDTDAVVDVSAADVILKTKTDGCVSQVIIVGNPTGLGIVVDPIHDIALKIADKRKDVGALNDISFLACSSSANQFCVNSAMIGSNIGALLVDLGIVANPDLDGDGRTDDLTAIFVKGSVKTVKVLGDMAGDMVVAGADAKGYCVGKLDVRNGTVSGDVVTLTGGMKKLSVKGGDVTGVVDVRGDLGKMSVLAAKDATGTLVGGALNGADVMVNGVLKGLAANEVMSSLITGREITKITVKGNLTDSSITAQRLGSIGVGGAIAGAVGDEVYALDSESEFRISDGTQSALVTALNPVSFGNVRAHVGAFGWAVGGPEGGYGTILYTANGGESWVRQGTAGVIPDATIYDVAAIDEQTAWVVAGDGSILRTDDGGATWVAQNSTVTRGLFKISAANALVAWVVGEGGVILNTTDGGATWVQQGVGQVPNVHYQGVCAIDALSVWVTGQTDGGYGAIVRSTDGGLTWERLGSSATVPDTYFLDITVLADGTGWTAGHGPNTLGTTDFGDNWELQQGSMDPAHWFWDANGTCAVDSNTAWVVEDYGGIYHTGDGGATWYRQEANAEGFLLMGADALNTHMAWAAGRAFSTPGGVIVYTRNEGRTWEHQALPVDIGLSGISFVR